MNIIMMTRSLNIEAVLRRAARPHFMSPPGGNLLRRFGMRFAAGGFLPRLPVVLSVSIACGLTMPALAESKEIQISTTYLSFSPASIAAEVGDRIVWLNNSGVLHEIYFPVNPTNSGEPRLRYVLNGNRDVSIIVSKPGDYVYFCRWHGMQGSIHVARQSAH